MTVYKPTLFSSWNKRNRVMFWSRLVSKILMYVYFLTSTANMNKSPFLLGTEIIFANRLHIWTLIF